MSVSLTEVYRVYRDKPVRLKLTIGFAQQGVSNIHLNGVPLASDHPGDWEGEIAAQGKDLLGKVLTCTTTVTAIRDLDLLKLKVKLGSEE